MWRWWYAFLYYLSWVWFGLFGVVLGVLSLPLLPWAGHPGLARRMRAVIRALFRLYEWWFNTSGLLRVRWTGLGPEGLEPGCVYIANHPCLLDATFLLARIPDALCILKPSLLANPSMGAAARVACYEAGGNLIDMVHRVSARVQTGQALLVFPEGTRTEPGRAPGSFRTGFALIAHRAKAPVRLITIRCSEGLVPRGRAWWRPPTVLPAWIELQAGPALRPGDHASALELGQAAEQTLRAQLAEQVVVAERAAAHPAKSIQSLNTQAS